MDEFLADERKLLNGEALTADSANTVRDVPPQFRQWILDNRERIAKARTKGTESYFLRDNKAYVDGILDPKPNALQTAQKRHSARTEEQVRDIRRRWTLRNAEMRHAARTASEIENIKLRAWNRQLLAFNPNLSQSEREAIAKNWLEIERGLGIKKGRMMTHEEANTGRVNPNYGQKGYNINCSTCSGTYMLRRFGFDVQAKANIPANAEVAALSIGDTTWDKWTNGKASYISTAEWMNAKSYKMMNKNRYMEFLDESTKEPGIYEWNVGYKGNNGHSTLLRRKADGALERIEQQVPNGSSCTIDSILQSLSEKPHKVRGIMRIDIAIFNTRYLSIVKKI